LVETSACGLALAGLLLALAVARDAPRPARVLVVALLATTAFSLRPDAMLVPLIAAVLIGVQGRSWRAALAVALFPLLVAVPWALRNGRVADGRFVAVGLGVNLLGAIGESVDVG